MITEFKLPELGENIDSADVISVLVKAGDEVKKDQGVIEIETDKATIEVPSSYEGTIKEVFVKEGDKVKVGQAILALEDGVKNRKETVKKEEGTGKSGQELQKKSEQKTAADIQKEVKQEQKRRTHPAGEVEVKLPELGENIDSADVINVLVKSGDMIEKEQGIIEIETDKATVEVPSPVSGKVINVLIKEGDKAAVGQVLIKVEAGEVEEAVTETIEESQGQQAETVEAKKEEAEKAELRGEKEITEFSEKPDTQPPIVRGAAPAAPSVRRIARELGVDINKVQGSDPSGRISMDDVKAYVKKLNLERESGFGAGIKAEALPDFTKWGDVERKDMSNIREKTARHLSYAWAYTPHVTQFDKADITNLEKVRKDLNLKAEKEGAKITITAILIKVLTSALKLFPQFNSSIDMERKQVIYKKYFNIGIAVDTDHGLIVPVIKNTDRKNLLELAVEMSRLAESARTRKVSLEDLQGGCITITNLGGIGGTYFTPIVNSPEVAILGVSRGSYEPFYKDGRFEPRLILPVSLSYDHRIIDGADAARFLRWVCEALEQPMNMLL
jgi:pyruvate dehydrogenase E2 component (dihydrolipoyllysine-residue acetyltransferase)